MSIRTFFKNWSYRRRLKKSGLYFPLHCKVHGVKHPERQGGIVQSQKDDPLQLVHVALPDYPYNVYVYSISLNRVLGYLDETLSKKFVYLFGKGFCRDGYVEKITGGEPYKYRGCNIIILETAVLLEGEQDFSALREV